MDRLGCIRAFVTAADSGSFKAAADELSFTPAMIGRQVRWLEDHLRVQLIARTTRRQSLTEAGRIYLDHARAVLAEAEAGERSVTSLSAIPTGMLRIDAPHSFGALTLAPALVEFHRTYPEVAIELTLNNRIVDLLEEGYDAVIRAGKLADSGLIARKLAPHRLVACASPRYLARQGRLDHPSDLVGHACLRFRPRAAQEVWRFASAEGELVEVPVRGSLTSNSGHALRAAALEGAGVILQSHALIADDLAAGRLVRVLPDWTPPPLPMHLLYAGVREPAPKLRAFIDFMAARFGRGS